MFIELRTYFQVIVSACSTFWSKPDFAFLGNLNKLQPDTQKICHNYSLINYVRTFVNLLAPEFYI